MPKWAWSSPIRTAPIRGTRVKASQKSELGKVIYANSITLTPGTVSIDIDGSYISVHALTRDFAADLRTGDMDRRVTNFVNEA